MTVFKDLHIIVFLINAADLKFNFMSRSSMSLNFNDLKKISIFKIQPIPLN